MPLFKTKKAELTKEAQNLLKQGKSKQEALEILCEKHKNLTKETARILTYIPAPKNKKKYAPFNYALTALYILTAGFILRHEFSLSVLLVFSLFAVVSALMLIKYYVWLAAVAATMLISTGAVYFFMHGIKDDPAFIAALAALSLLLTILPLWLESKLKSKPNKEKLKVTDKNGNKKFKIEYSFND